MRDSRFAAAAGKLFQSGIRRGGFARGYACLAKTNGVAAWTAEEAQAQFGLEDYFDQSHLNARGARRFTAMIAPAIANLLRPMPRPAAETHQTQ